MPAAASDQNVSTLRQQQTKIGTIVAAYFLISIALVFVNKLLLTKGTSIPAPLFVTWFQCLVTVGICWAFGELGKDAAEGSFFRQFPRFEYKREVAAKLAVLSIVFVGMVAFNNLSLKYVEVSFYNVARSLTIVFNVVLTYILLKETTSSQTVACLAAVIVGFFVGSRGEVHFSLIGTFYGVVSSLFVSLNSIYTKKVMGLVDNNTWKLTAYNNVNACFLFVPLMLVSGEIDIISANSHLLVSPRFWFIMVVGGVFGFLIGIVTIMQIKATSPLTHNISGTAKACVQTVFAFMIWQNPTTFENILGIVLVLGGTLAYAWVRNIEMANAAGSGPASKGAATQAGASGSGAAMASVASVSSASAGSAGGRGGDEENPPGASSSSGGR
jgi:GDP-fucose transporter C1